jgi:hypothetical protein
VLLYHRGSPSSTDVFTYVELIPMSAPAGRNSVCSVVNAPHNHISSVEICWDSVTGDTALYLHSSVSIAVTLLSRDRVSIDHVDATRLTAKNGARSKGCMNGAPPGRTWS